MANRIKKFFSRLLTIEIDPERRARSIAIGTAIAFSPLLGIQTPILFIVSFLLNLNASVVFAVVYGINNPWTMVPIIILNYCIGDLLLWKLMGIDLRPYDPAWAIWVTNKISYYTGMTQLCFWYYCIGGTLVAIVSGLLIYYLIHIVQHVTVARREDHNAK